MSRGRARDLLDGLDHEAERSSTLTADEVRTVLNGATQIRRPVEPQPELGCEGAEWNPAGMFWRWLYPASISRGFVCPFGAPGDAMRVRLHTEGSDMGFYTEKGAVWIRITWVRVERVYYQWARAPQWLWVVQFKKVEGPE